MECESRDCVWGGCRMGAVQVVQGFANMPDPTHWYPLRTPSNRHPLCSHAASWTYARPSTPRSCGCKASTSSRCRPKHPFRAYKHRSPPSIARSTHSMRPIRLPKPTSWLPCTCECGHCVGWAVPPLRHTTAITSCMVALHSPRSPFGAYARRLQGFTDANRQRALPFAEGGHLCLPAVGVLPRSTERPQRLQLVRLLFEHQVGNRYTTVCCSVGAQ